MANTLFPLTDNNTIVDDMRVALGNMCLQMK